jgi:predicted DCC family thiol-disulfide oxidoreductase YuxK
MSNPSRIVFVDGHCTLCNKWVQFVMKRDKSKKIHFASIQGETAKRFLSAEDRTNVNYIQYYRDIKFFRRSSAVVRILRDLNGMWKLSVLFLAVPPFIRDALYDFVAARRYKWFPRKDSCELTGFSTKNILP